MNPPPGIEALPNGQWVIEGDTHLGAWAKQHGTIVTDPGLFRWLKPHLEGVKVAFDLGANIGDHTRAYLDMGMQVVAVEPNLLVFECLRHNCPDATCMAFAASDAKGVLRFSQLDNVGASRITADGGTEVEARPIDDLARNLPNPDYVKIDIEGFEVFALRGMIETLKRCKPILFIEVNAGALAANGHALSDIESILLEVGYTDFKTYPEHAQRDWPQYDLLVKP